MTDGVDPNQQLRLQPGWWARLEGETLDLEALVGAFGEASRVYVRLLDGRYYLRMEDFDEVGEGGNVESRAREVLRVMNGASRVEHGDSREVRVDASARVDPDGQIQHFVNMSATIHGRGRLSAELTVSGQASSGSHVAEGADVRLPDVPS